MDERVKTVRFVVARTIFERFKNKCDFYDLYVGDIGVFLLQKFIDGEFDQELEIPVDPKE